MGRIFRWGGILTAVVLAGGCAVSHKHVVAPTTVEPSLNATKAELVARYNREASAVQTLVATVRMSPTAGSALSGVIEQYHDVNGYILASRPASIRVIGQAPVVAKDIFDMVSDGKTFKIFIPSKNKFIVGPDELEQTAKKPIENLRPQHLLEALLWTAIPGDAPVLLEQTDQPPKRYYVLTVAKNAPGGWSLDRKIWIDRSDLQMSKLEIFGPGGDLISDIHFSAWQKSDTLVYPREITLSRPQDDYQLGIHISQLALNQSIDAEKFQLAQPKGTELVQLGEAKQP